MQASTNEDVLGIGQNKSKVKLCGSFW